MVKGMSSMTGVTIALWLRRCVLWIPRCVHWTPRIALILALFALFAICAPTPNSNFAIAQSRAQPTPPSLADPMRPPPILARVVRPMPAAVSTPAPAPPGPLTAIWSVGGRRQAIVGDETVVVGTRVGAMQVARITDDEVVFAGPNGEHRLALNAGIEKIEKIEKSVINPRSDLSARTASTEQNP